MVEWKRVEVKSDIDTLIDAPDVTLCTTTSEIDEPETKDGANLAGPVPRPPAGADETAGQKGAPITAGNEIKAPPVTGILVSFSRNAARRRTEGGQFFPPPRRVSYLAHAPGTGGSGGARAAAAAGFFARRRRARGTSPPVIRATIPGRTGDRYALLIAAGNGKYSRRGGANKCDGIVVAVDVSAGLPHCANVSGRARANRSGRESMSRLDGRREDLRNTRGMPGRRPAR